MKIGAATGVMDVYSLSTLMSSLRRGSGLRASLCADASVNLQLDSGQFGISLILNLIFTSWTQRNVFFFFL